jgi:hypothetical protein
MRTYLEKKKKIDVNTKKSMAAIRLRLSIKLEVFTKYLHRANSKIQLPIKLD